MKFLAMLKALARLGILEPTSLDKSGLKTIALSLLC